MALVGAYSKTHSREPQEVNEEDVYVARVNGSDEVVTEKSYLDIPLRVGSNKEIAAGSWHGSAIFSYVAAPPEIFSSIKRVAGDIPVKTEGTWPVNEFSRS